MDDVTLEAYTLALKDLDMRAFQVAMAFISEARRDKGETAFPELGYILDVIDIARERFTTVAKPELDTRPVMAPMMEVKQLGKGKR